MRMAWIILWAGAIVVVLMLKISGIIGTALLFLVLMALLLTGIILFRRQQT
jgi:hypothetical protein